MEVTLSQAEVDALQQILSRHGDVLENFEKDLLVKVLRKVKKAEENARHSSSRTRPSPPPNEVGPSPGSLRALRQKFSEIFGRWGLELREADVAERRSGFMKQEAGSGGVRYIFGRDELGEYLEFYAFHRIAGDRHARIYASGEVMSLDVLETMYLVDRNDPEVTARHRGEMQEHNKKLLGELEEAGLLTGGPVPNSFLVSAYLAGGEVAPERNPQLATANPMSDVVPPRSAWQRTLDEIKLGRGCEDPRCAGYPCEYPRALSFDHRPGMVKLFEISQAINGKGRTGRFVRRGAGGVNTSEKITWQAILAEIEKCDVVCKNCHEVRNTERGGAERQERPQSED